jgi:hypothetical protein
MYQYGLQVAKEWAQLLMNHREMDSTFNRFYSKGTGNFDLTAIRLLEIDVSSEHVKVCMLSVLGYIDQSPFTVRCRLA